MPASVSKERTQIVKALGAEVILTDTTWYEKVQLLSKSITIITSNYMMPMQFENLNPEIHRRTTAIEILNDTDGKLIFSLLVLVLVVL